MKVSQMKEKLCIKSKIASRIQCGRQYNGRYEMVQYIYEQQKKLMAISSLSDRDIALEKSFS